MNTDLELAVRCRDDVIVRDWRAITAITDEDWRSLSDQSLTLCDVQRNPMVDKLIVPVVRLTFTFDIADTYMDAFDIQCLVQGRVQALTQQRLGELFYDYYVSVWIGSIDITVAIFQYSSDER